VNEEVMCEDTHNGEGFLITSNFYHIPFVL